MIIVDEEQEHTYRSESAPRYSAHEVARQRAGIDGAAAAVVGNGTGNHLSAIGVDGHGLAGCKSLSIKGIYGTDFFVSVSTYRCINSTLLQQLQIQG